MITTLKELPVKTWGGKERREKKLKKDSKLARERKREEKRRGEPVGVRRKAGWAEYTIEKVAILSPQNILSGIL